MRFLHNITSNYIIITFIRKYCNIFESTKSISFEYMRRAGHFVHRWRHKRGEMAGKRAQNGRNSGGHEGAGRKNRPAPSRLAPYSKPRHAVHLHNLCSRTGIQDTCIQLAHLSWRRKLKKEPLIRVRIAEFGPSPPLADVTQ